jgi:cytochrome b561
MVAIPISGWLMSSAKGYQTVWFGILPIPDLLDKNEQLLEVFQETHEILNYVLATLVLGHAAAAVKHHVRDKDKVLRRMLPWRSN